MRSRAGFTLAEVGFSTAIVGFAVAATVLAVLQIYRSQVRSSERIEAAITASTLLSRAQHFAPLLQINRAMDCYSLYAVPSLAKFSLRVEDTLHGPPGPQVAYYHATSTMVTWTGYSWNLDWKLFGGNPQQVSPPEVAKTPIPSVLADAGTFGFSEADQSSIKQGSGYKTNWESFTEYGNDRVVGKLQATYYKNYQPPPPVPNDRHLGVLTGAWNFPLDVRGTGSLGYQGGEDPVTILGELSDWNYKSGTETTSATDALSTEGDEHRWLDTTDIWSQNHRTDKGEPFSDLNNNGFWDSGEPFLDLDGDGALTPLGRRRLYYVHAANRLWSWQVGIAPLPPFGDQADWHQDINPWLNLSPMANKLIGFRTSQIGLTIYQGSSAWTGPKAREMTIWSGAFRRHPVFSRSLGDVTNHYESVLPFAAKIQLATAGRFLFFDPGDR